MKRQSVMLFLLMQALLLQAQWQPTNGPYTPYVDAMSIKGNNLIVISRNFEGGPYISTDNGDHWAIREKGLPEKVYGYSVLTIDSCFFFIGGYNNPMSLFRSGINDSIWIKLTDGLPSELNLRYVYDHNGKLYLSTLEAGVFSSLDKGKSWKEDGTGIHANTIRLFISSGETVYAVGEYYDLDKDYLYKRQSNDTVWTQIYPELPYWPIDIAIKDSVIILASIAGVYRSVDYGQSWTPFNQGLPSASFLTLIGDTVFTLTSDSGVYKAGIKGTSWTLVHSGNSFSEPRAFRSNDSSLYIGTWGAFYMSKDMGFTWTMKNNGLMPGYIYSLAEIQTNLFASTWSGVFKSGDQGTNWQLLSNYPAKNTASLFAVRNNQLYSGTWNGHMYTSGDSGETWQTVETGLQKTSVISIIVKDTSVFAGMSGVGIYRLDEAGNVWKRVKQGGHPRSFGLQDSSLFAAYDSNIILRTIDQGKTWQTVNNGYNDQYCNAITGYGKSVFACGYHMFRSNDDGLNWVLADNGLPYDSGFCTLASHDSNVYAGLVTGVWVTRDGKYWGDVSSGLPGIYATAMHASGGEMYLGTTKGVWKRPHSELNFLQIEKDTLRMPATVSSTDSNVVYSNTDWTIKGGLPGWLNVDHTGGLGCGSLQFQIMLENPENKPRSADITLISTNAPSCHFIILQEGKTGIKRSTDRNMIITPNPARDMILIRGIEGMPDLNVELSNLSGEIVYNRSFSQVNDIRIDLTSVAEGIYMLKLKAPDLLIVRKVLVIK